MHGDCDFWNIWVRRLAIVPVIFFNPSVGGIPMRMLLKAQADTLNSNPKIKDGSLGDDLNSIIADAKPEADRLYHGK